MISAVIIRIIAGSIAILMLTGCSPTPSFTWEGKWRGDRKIKASAGQSEAVAYSLSMVRLELRENGTFNLLDGGFVIDGTYSISGNEARLEAKKFMELGSAEPRPITLKITGTHQLTLIDLNTAFPGPIQLVPESQRTP